MRDLLAQMRESHATPTTGLRHLQVRANWCVSTRSKSGAVTRVANSPTRRIVAPMRPAVSLLYPCGSWIYLSGRTCHSMCGGGEHLPGLVRSELRKR